MEKELFEWVKASNEVPELEKFFNLRIDGKPYHGLFSKLESGLMCGAGSIVLPESNFHRIEWLKPIPQSSLKEDTAEYKANFLWRFPDDSIESIGYEFANAKTEGYQKECWNDLIEKIKSASLKPNKLSDSIGTFKWSELEKIASPDKWMEMYKAYSEMLTHEDVAGWWQEQFNIANAERNEVKLSAEKYQIAIANLIEAIPSQTNDRDWWPDSLTDAVNEANKLLENKKPNQK